MGQDSTGVMRAWCLLLCTLGVLLVGASGSFLPSAAHRLLGHFHHLLESNWLELGKQEGHFEAPVDFSKLPPNYHTEEKEQRRVGNATVHRRHEINKVTDNETGATLFFERTVTSIEQGKPGLVERWKGNQAESSEEGAGSKAGAKPILGRRILRIPHPRLAFFIIHLPRTARSRKASDAGWRAGVSLSDRRHRLLAIRDGLMEVPRPMKKAPLIVTLAQRRAVERKPHFLFFFRKL